MISIRFSELDIFKPNEDSSKNACVGENGYHDFQTYGEGYLHAASRLIKSVLDQDFDVETDVIVHPILYSVRHAIELSIKHAMEELGKSFDGVKRKSGHGLKPLWESFQLVSQRDRRLKMIENELNCFVIYLDEVDPDAQDFRYPVNSDGQRTLSKKRIVDMEVLSTAIDMLIKELKKLFNLLPVIRDERRYNAYTKKLNREELQKLSLELPEYESWGQKDSINLVRYKWKLEYSISSSDFSDATKFIRQHREFSGNIGKEISLLFIDDELVRLLVLARHEIDLRNQEQRGLPMLELILKSSPYPTIYNTLRERLSIDVVADISTIFYLSRDGHLSEAYEEQFERRRTEISIDLKHSDSAIQTAFEHVFSKTTFKRHFLNGISKLGRKTIIKILPESVLA